MHAERVTDSIAYHAEGPVWSPRWGGLRWVDMLAGDVLSLASDGTVRRRNVGSIAAAVRPRRGGGAVIAVERGFTLEQADGTLTPLPDVWAHDEARMNEGGCDPDGRFWCGSMAYDRKPGSAVMYRLDPDRSIRVAMTGVTISNGLEWTPDGSMAYYADTATHQVDVFDYDRDAGLTGRRPFVRMNDDEAPDGLTVDSTGAVWVAMNGSGAVRRYTPTGHLDGEVRLPTAQVTACTFGGPDLDRLFITTSREGMARDDDPIAGSLFRADVGVAGQPVREFAG